MSAVLAGLGVSVLASSAGAAVKLQAVGETSVGATDNAPSAPDVPLPGGTEKAAGGFLVLRPGLVLGLLTGRAVQRLSYTFDYNLYFSRETSSSSSNRLEYRGFFELSPRVNATLGASATESDSYAALTLAPPASGVLPLLPSGASKLFQASVDELMSFELTVGLRAWEGAGLVWGTPIFDTEAPSTLAPNARAGLEYSWTADAIGVEGRADYAIVRDGVAANGAPLRLQRDLVSRGTLFYRHDIGRYLTGRVEGGVARLDRLETGGRFYYPVAGASLTYSDIFGEAELAYAHTVTTNVLLGQTTVADELRLRGGVPLDRRGIFTLSASSGYQRGRLLDEQARAAARVSVLVADATFGWQAQPWVLLGIRAQHIDQRSDVRVVTLPVSFVQNNVMLGAAFKFPPDPEMPASYRSPNRVDRTDERRTSTLPDPQAIPTPTGRGQ